MILTCSPGRIEHHLVANLERHGNVEVSWRTQPVDIQINRRLAEDPLAYPITVTTNIEREGTLQTQLIQARYVIACDGARSWTRKHLNIPLKGDLTDSTWGQSPVTELQSLQLTQIVRCDGRRTEDKLP